MPYEDDSSITVRQAFLALSDYVWRFAQSAGDDLLTLLGDTGIEPDGGPTDPAAWDDWLISVERIRRGEEPRT
jgi:hypothetical protein